MPLVTGLLRFASAPEVTPMSQPKSKPPIAGNTNAVPVARQSTGILFLETAVVAGNSCACSGSISSNDGRSSSFMLIRGETPCLVRSMRVSRPLENPRERLARVSTRESSPRRVAPRMGDALKCLDGRLARVQDVSRTRFLRCARGDVATVEATLERVRLIPLNARRTPCRATSTLEPLNFYPRR